jgi:CRISPR-associated protein Csm1
MIDDTTLKITLAALFHDIGKFADKKALAITNHYIERNEGIYLPKYQDHHTHYHAVYTAAFIEYKKNLLPIQLNHTPWGEGDSFINLAAGHHRPETPLQWVIALADRLSSGWDRDTFDSEYNCKISVKDYKKTRLLTLFEQLNFEKPLSFSSRDNFSYCYPLKAVSPESIFPGLIKDTLSHTIKDAQQEYHSLYEDFEKALKNLKNKQDNLELWLESFESLLMIYTSAIPSARVGEVVPDVSLYDHLRTTAALATAIYLYHVKQGLTIEAVNNYNDKKFILINCDFYGIQNFIFSGFSDSRKYRSKILRGRSFAVSLLTELAADMLCCALSLPFTSVLFNTAGKFTLVAPNDPDTGEIVEEAEDKINKWLHKVSYGETAIGFTCVKASCNDFVSGKFPLFWDNMAVVNDEKKFSRLNMEQYGGAVKDYLNCFDNTLNHPLCPVCGKRPSQRKSENSHYVSDMISSCNLCRDHIFLGTNLVKKNYMAIIQKDADNIKKENWLFEPIFGTYQVIFPDDHNEYHMNRLFEKGHIVRYWYLGLDSMEGVSIEGAVKFINGHVPVYRESDEKDKRITSHLEKGEVIRDKMDLPKSLTHISRKALNLTEEQGRFQGVDALGVLKADVDYLGILMSCGLEKKRFTLSRAATLSRQLHYYFTLYLPHFIRNHPDYYDVYTVFAGGDDLFLIGPWNHIFTLSLELRKSFKHYVCHNDAITLSAGITVHKAHTPVDFMASMAEHALEQSKDRGRNRLTLFNETVNWKETDELMAVKETLELWLSQGIINNSMLYRLNSLIEMASQAKEIVHYKEIHLKDLYCTKWRALLAYSIERNVAKSKDKEERKAYIKDLLEKFTLWLDTYGRKLKIPLWYILYINRTTI